MSLRDLENHAVVARILANGTTTFHELYQGKIPTLDGKNDPIPTEYQHYVLLVGNRIVNLLTWSKQLDHSVLYLSNFAASRSMKKAGVSRYTHLAYHIENYIIRIESLYDRVLQLVDAVFHLCNDPVNCTSDVVLSNRKVTRTDIPAALKPLKKLLKGYRFERNTIVHQESYQDSSLRRLELFTVANENPSGLAPHFAERLPLVLKEVASDVVREKKREYALLNKKLQAALSTIMDKLGPQYDRVERSLRP